MADEQLNMARFEEIISAYSSSYNNSPRSTAQLVQYCKSKQYRFKYDQLRPFYSVWRTKRDESKAVAKAALAATAQTTPGTPKPDDREAIDWAVFWTEYRTKHGYPPKKALHLWNFAKDDKHLAVSYKVARQAFDRMIVENTPSEPTAIEGRTRSASSVTSSATNILSLRVTRRTSDERLSEIKSKFLELLESFRKEIRHDPRDAHQLFTFVTEHTPYKARHGDLAKCLSYGAKHEWYAPMKRKTLKKPKIVSERDTTEGTDRDEGTDVEAEEGVEAESEFVLEVDHERMAALKISSGDATEEKAELTLIEVLSDGDIEVVLAAYAVEFDNPPRNAAQVRRFANVHYEQKGQRLKYKAVRFAFDRWAARGSVMPKKMETEESTEATTATTTVSGSEDEGC